jgi:histone acetyltransferase (RNA polymerase elongator complex component)
MIDHYASERAPAGSELEVGFFRGGIPDAAQLQACGGLPVRVSCNPADLSRQESQRLRSSGCEIIELEVLSLDPYVLRSCERGYTVGRVEGMIRILAEMGFRIGVHLTPGLPGSDLDSSLADVEKIAAGGAVDFVRVWPALAFQGAGLAGWVQDGRWVPLGLPEAVSLIESMLEALDKASIPVIRVGLQPGQDIPVQAIAGPYHPNLRGEVETRRFRRRMMDALSRSEHGDCAILRVHPKDISWAKGTSNVNARTLRTRLGISEIRIEADPAVARGTVVVGGNG